MLVAQTSLESRSCITRMRLDEIAALCVRKLLMRCHAPLSVHMTLSMSCGVQEQYIELSSDIEPNSSLFGLEERTASGGLRLQRGGPPLAMWNHDTLAANADTNLYGSHPFVMEVRPGAASHSHLASGFTCRQHHLMHDSQKTLKHRKAPRCHAYRQQLA